MKEAIERLEQETRQWARASKSKKVAHGGHKKAKHKRNWYDDGKVAPNKDKEHCETAEKSD